MTWIATLDEKSAKNMERVPAIELDVTAMRDLDIRCAGSPIMEVIDWYRTDKRGRLLPVVAGDALLGAVTLQADGMLFIEAVLILLSDKRVSQAQLWGVFANRMVSEPESRERWDDELFYLWIRWHHLCETHGELEQIEQLRKLFAGMHWTNPLLPQQATAADTNRRGIQLEEGALEMPQAAEFTEARPWTAKQRRLVERLLNPEQYDPSAGAEQGRTERDFVPLDELFRRTDEETMRMQMQQAALPTQQAENRRGEREGRYARATVGPAEPGTYGTSMLQQQFAARQQAAAMIPQPENAASMRMVEARPETGRNTVPVRDREIVDDDNANIVRSWMQVPYEGLVRAMRQRDERQRATLLNTFHNMQGVNGTVEVLISRLLAARRTVLQHNGITEQEAEARAEALFELCTRRRNNSLLQEQNRLENRVRIGLSELAGARGLAPDVIQQAEQVTHDVREETLRTMLDLYAGDGITRQRFSYVGNFADRLSAADLEELATGPVESQGPATAPGGPQLLPTGMQTTPVGMLLPAGPSMAAIDRRLSQLQNIVATLARHIMPAADPSTQARPPREE